MKPEILQKWEAAARELWSESPELHSRYNFDLQSYLSLVRLRLEAQDEWRDNPGLQKEFLGNFNTFLAYKRSVNNRRG